MARLANKVALVTGAASEPGLGSSTARRFAEEGATVILTDLDLAGAQRVAQSIRDNGGKAVAMEQNVASEADWDAIMATITADHGGLDILVNNAGIAVLRTIEEFTTADWDKQLLVNLNSVFYGTKRAVVAMRAAGRKGSIVNISS
ncbi:MAG: SDR family NAD(P)-dependent oxidoreductase, partial [Sphingopyxis sp.]